MAAPVRYFGVHQVLPKGTEALGKLASLRETITGRDEPDLRVHIYIFRARKTP